MYDNSCNFGLFKSSIYTAKYMYDKIIDLNNKSYTPKYQIVDARINAII